MTILQRQQRQTSLGTRRKTSEMTDYDVKVVEAAASARCTGRIWYVTTWGKAHYVAMDSDDFRPYGKRSICWIAFPPRVSEAQNV
jgi:hypothetical protein